MPSLFGVRTDSAPSRGCRRACTCRSCTQTGGSGARARRRRARRAQVPLGWAAEWQHLRGAQRVGCTAAAGVPGVMLQRHAPLERTSRSRSGPLAPSAGRARGRAAVRLLPVTGGGCIKCWRQRARLTARWAADGALGCRRARPRGAAAGPRARRGRAAGGACAMQARVAARSGERELPSREGPCDSARAPRAPPQLPCPLLRAGASRGPRQPARADPLRTICGWPAMAASAPPRGAAQKPGELASGACYARIKVPIVTSYGDKHDHAKVATGAAARGFARPRDRLAHWLHSAALLPAEAPSCEAPLRCSGNTPSTRPPPCQHAQGRWPARRWCGARHGTSERPACRPHFVSRP